MITMITMMQLKGIPQLDYHTHNQTYALSYRGSYTNVETAPPRHIAQKQHYSNRNASSSRLTVRRTIIACALSILKLSCRDSALKQFIQLPVASPGDIRNPEVNQHDANKPDSEEHVSGFGSNSLQFNWNDDVSHRSNDGVAADGQSGYLGTESS